jgi:hypothetical protein
VLLQCAAAPSYLDHYLRMPHKLRFSRIHGSFAICRLEAGAALPAWACRGAFFSITSTAEEFSVVCPQTQVPPEIAHEGDWVCLKLQGPFPFSETGILTSFVQPLSERAIPLFAISTFDTDYVLVKQGWVDRAVAALREAGHREV